VKTISAIRSPLHGGQLRKIAKHYGIPAKRLLDFSVNINPAGPPRSVMEALRRALHDSTTLTSYPDLELAELRQTISACAGVGPENIAIANGFVPLLDSVLRSCEIKRCLLPEPCFSEYRNGLQNARVEVIPHRLSHENAFEYAIDTIRKELVDHSCDAILLANPQNPSGVLCDTEKIQRLIEMAVHHGAAVLLDEAFIDYCPSASVVREGMEDANVIVFRSVTKFFAIPGLRVAYAIGASSKIRAMNRLIAPWAVTSLASIAVCAALADQAYADESRVTNERQRSWLEAEFTKLQITTYPSHTNFLLLRFPPHVNVDLLWERMIVEEEIVLRSCANFQELAPGHLRTAVRSEAENERLTCGLSRALASLEG
jgi:threonine-phosphate decarboxylase